MLKSLILLGSIFSLSLSGSDLELTTRYKLVNNSYSRFGTSNLYNLNSSCIFDLDLLSYDDSNKIVLHTFNLSSDFNYNDNPLDNSFNYAIRDFVVDLTLNDYTNSIEFYLDLVNTSVINDTSLDFNLSYNFDFRVRIYQYTSSSVIESEAHHYFNYDFSMSTFTNDFSFTGLYNVLTIGRIEILNISSLFSQMNDIWLDGNDYGNQIGFQNGYLEGKEVGFDEGFEEGKVSSLANPFDIIRSALKGPLDFLMLEIAPNITIGTILLIPLSITILVFLLKGLVK